MIAGLEALPCAPRRAGRPARRSLCRTALGAPPASGRCSRSSRSPRRPGATPPRRSGERQREGLLALVVGVVEAASIVLLDSPACRTSSACRDSKSATDAPLPSRTARARGRSWSSTRRSPTGSGPGSAPSVAVCSWARRRTARRWSVSRNPLWNSDSGTPNRVPHWYVPLAQAAADPETAEGIRESRSLIVRTRGDPGRAVPPVPRRARRALSRPAGEPRAEPARCPRRTHPLVDDRHGPARCRRPASPASPCCSPPSGSTPSSPSA